MEYSRQKKEYLKDLGWGRAWSFWRPERILEDKRRSEKQEIKMEIKVDTVSTEALRAVVRS